MKVKVKRLQKDVAIPAYHSKGAAGFDFHSTEDIILPPPTIEYIQLEGEELRQAQDDFIMQMLNTVLNEEKEVLINRLGEEKLRKFILERTTNKAFTKSVVKVHPVSIGTGLAMEIPPGHELEIRGRSGLSFKNDIIAVNGTIDSDYRGEIHVKLYNIGTKEIHLSKGSRIAQGIIKPVIQVEFEEVDKLSPTERGNNGFGSTGLK